MVGGCHLGAAGIVLVTTLPPRASWPSLVTLAVVGVAAIVLWDRADSAVRQAADWLKYGITFDAPISWEVQSPQKNFRDDARRDDQTLVPVGA